MTLDVECCIWCDDGCTKEFITSLAFGEEDQIICVLNRLICTNMLELCKFGRLYENKKKQRGRRTKRRNYTPSTLLNVCVCFRARTQVLLCTIRLKSDAEKMLLHCKSNLLQILHNKIQYVSSYTFSEHFFWFVCSPDGLSSIPTNCRTMPYHYRNTAVHNSMQIIFIFTIVWNESLAWNLYKQKSVEKANRQANKMDSR